MFCSKCGKELTHDARFCGGCGAAASDEAITSQKNEICIMESTGNIQNSRVLLHQYRDISKKTIKCQHCQYEGHFGVMSSNFSIYSWIALICGVWFLYKWLFVDASVIYLFISIAQFIFIAVNKNFVCQCPSCKIISTFRFPIFGAQKV